MNKKIENAIKHSINLMYKSEVQEVKFTVDDSEIEVFKNKLGIVARIEVIENNELVIREYKVVEPTHNYTYVLESEGFQDISRRRC